MRRFSEDSSTASWHQPEFRLRPGDGQGSDAYPERQPYFREMPRLLIHETGVHFADVFCYLLGTPDGVYADLRRINPTIKGEDAGYFIFEYATMAVAPYLTEIVIWITRLKICE